MEQENVSDNLNNKQIRAQKNTYWLMLAIAIVLTLLLHSIAFFFWVGVLVIIFSIAAIILPAINKKVAWGTCIAVSLMFWGVLLLFASCDSSCSACNGNGQITCSNCNGKNISTCSRCDGEGRVPGILWGTNKCSKCNGQGRTYCVHCVGGKRKCYKCNGTGKLK